MESLEKAFRDLYIENILNGMENGSFTIEDKIELIEDVECGSLDELFDDFKIQYNRIANRFEITATITNSHILRMTTQEMVDIELGT